MGSFIKVKTVIQATLLVSVFFAFFSCGKEEDVPLQFEEGQRTGVFALDADAISCVSRYFRAAPVAGDPPPEADAVAWHVAMDMGRLLWSDPDNHLEIVSMRFEVRNSQCIEDFRFDVTDSMKACMTLTSDLPNENYELWTNPSTTLPWTTAIQHIGPNNTVKFSKLLHIYGMTPRIPKGVDPTFYVPNCTANGLIKITAVKYGDSISSGKNVRKSFPFSVIFQ